MGVLGKPYVSSKSEIAELKDNPSWGGRGYGWLGSASQTVYELKHKIW